MQCFLIKIDIFLSRILKNIYFKHYLLKKNNSTLRDYDYYFESRDRKLGCPSCWFSSETSLSLIHHPHAS